MRVIYRASPVILSCLLLYAAIWHTWGLLFGLGVHPYPAGTPWTYQLWSGFVPALTVLSLLGTIAGAYHLNNCHHKGCPRLGKHKIGGTPWCSRHQHEGRPERSVIDVLEAIEQKLTAIEAKL